MVFNRFQFAHTGAYQSFSTSFEFPIFPEFSFITVSLQLCWFFYDFIFYNLADSSISVGFILFRNFANIVFLIVQ